jgi:uncharacterized protein YdaU (DUF1376 family)
MKIENMLFDMGWEWYGIFWALVEKLAQESTHKLPRQYEKYAFALRTHEERIRNVVENYWLFELEDDVFYSNRLLSHFQEREWKRQKAQESAGHRWRKNEKKDANAWRTHKRTPCEDDAIKERKGKEKKDIESLDVVITDEEKKPTPKEIAVNFFATDPEEIISSISIAPEHKENVLAKIKEFISYWTELNKSGTKQRWELEETFEVQKRIAYWFRNDKNFNSSQFKKNGHFTD